MILPARIKTAIKIKAVIMEKKQGIGFLKDT